MNLFFRLLLPRPLNSKNLSHVSFPLESEAFSEQLVSEGKQAVEK